MFFIIGLILALACIFGSFVASGGAIGPLIEAMPFELLTILGSAIGVFVMGNTKASLLHTFSYIMMALKGPKYNKNSYIELLVTLFRLTRFAQSKGKMALEEHVENPDESSIFAMSPNVRDDAVTRDIICDYLRLVTLNLDDPYQLDDVMGRELKKNLEESLHTAHSLQGIADALPALGIVAAVLGVIKTMASINKPPAVLGEMIGGALVGTFLGVLLAYGIVGPLAGKIRDVVVQDSRYQAIIRVVFVAHLQGSPPQVSVELGRKEIPHECMPSFSELDLALSESSNPSA